MTTSAGAPKSTRSMPASTSRCTISSLSAWLTRQPSVFSANVGAGRPTQAPSGIGRPGAPTEHRGPLAINGNFPPGPAGGVQGVGQFRQARPVDARQQQRPAGDQRIACQQAAVGIGGDVGDHDIECPPAPGPSGDRGQPVRPPRSARSDCGIRCGAPAQPLPRPGRSRRPWRPPGAPPQSPARRSRCPRPAPSVPPDRAPAASAGRRAWRGAAPDPNAPAASMRSTLSAGAPGGGAVSIGTIVSEPTVTGRWYRRSRERHCSRSVTV